MITETPPTTIPDIAPAPAARNRTRVWVGAAVALVGSVIALGGAAVLVVFGSDGTLTTDRHAVTTPTTALVSDKAEISDIAGAMDVLGQPSVHINSDEDVFIGVGRADDVEAYLAGARYDEVTDIEGDPFRLPSRRHEGADAVAPPAAQDFWVQSGTSQLDWKLRDGDYRLVMMNPDGSSDLRTSARFGIELPHIPAIAGGILGLGLLIMAGGGIVAALRR